MNYDPQAISAVCDSPDLAVSIFRSVCHIQPGGDRIQLLYAIADGFSKIPYENVTKILKQYFYSDSEQRLRGAVELLEGYRDHGTGGTCFSLVHCLRSILDGYGFTSYIVMADMHHERDIHCAIMVKLDAVKVLLDPGYLIPYPVFLPPPGGFVRSRNYMNRVEYRRSLCGSFVDLYTVSSTKVVWRYRLKDQQVSDEQFLHFWQRSFGLNMMNSMVITKADDRGQIYLHNDRLRLIRYESKVNRRLKDNLESQVSALFGISSDLIRSARELIEDKRHKGEKEC
ncbi:hypothetical protein JW905_08610 [bacterium]|nr:hypothetical protein [candidate division CSSED10-310 bacterium]